jgi:hypothetical protein
VNSKGTYAQFPRECELNLQMDLLEKERPIVGGNNFGDYARTLDNNGDYDDDPFAGPNDLFSRNILTRQDY